MESRFCPLCGHGLIRLKAGPDQGRMGCKACHFVSYDNPAVTAFAFVEYDKCYLTLVRGQAPYRGRWELPGGFVEAGEHPATSVIREVFEETGLHVHTPRIIGVYTSRYGDKGKWTVDVAFHCKAPTDKVSLSLENSQAAWVEIEQMPVLAFEGERSALAELKQRLGAEKSSAPPMS